MSETDRYLALRRDKQMPLPDHPHPEFYEGDAAFKQGVGREANPYPPGDERAERWFRGWDRAAARKAASRS